MTTDENLEPAHGSAEAAAAFHGAPASNEPAFEVAADPLQPPPETQKRPWYGCCSLRAWVWTICILTWGVRLFFVSLPEYMSGDEGVAVSASKYDLASRFMLSSNWTERWQIVEEYSSGGRVIWIISHLLWGFVFPTDGRGAYAESALAMIIAMAALAGAARRLYGERGMLLCILLASVSPLFLNYTIRCIGTVQSFMWVCLALYFFSNSRWSAWSWIFGGLSFGFSFGTHYGSGPTILGIAAGMAVSLVMMLARRDLTITTKILRGLVIPSLGVTAAILPLALLECWARLAGSSFYKRYLEHEVLMNTRDLGTYGMWLRQMFELEPMYEVLIIVAMGFTFMSRSLTRRRKILFGALYSGVILLTISALAPRWIKPIYRILDFPHHWYYDVKALIKTGAREAMPVAPLYSADWDTYIPQPRMWISVVFFAAVALAIVLLRIPKLKFLGSPEEAEDIQDTAPPPAPFSRWSVVPAILVTSVVFTGWRQVSGMPRLSFPFWPVLLLGFVGILLKVMRDHYAGLIRGIAILGSALFLLGAWASYQTKTSFERAVMFADHYNYMRHWFGGPTAQDPLSYHPDAMYYDEGREGRPYIHIAKRRREDITVIGPPATLYPASAYEEEVWKPRDMDADMLRAGMAGWFSGEQLTRAWVFFEQENPHVKTYPPPGTPLVPKITGGLGPDGKEMKPGTHSYRGMELRFPKWKSTEEAAISATVSLPAIKGQEAPFGFEYMALTPLVPIGTTLTLSVHLGSKEIGKVDVPILPREQGYLYFEKMIETAAEAEEIRFEARMRVPQAQVKQTDGRIETADPYCPPVSLYIRRPFIGSVIVPKTGVIILDASEKYPGYPGIGETSSLLAFTRLNSDLPGMGVFVRTPVWSGDPNQPINFAGSFDESGNPKVELGINRRPVLIFSPKAAEGEQQWEGSGVRLVYRQVTVKQGSHGVFSLYLSSAAAAPGKSLELSFRVTGGDSPLTWFGVRDLEDPASFLPR